MFLGAEFGVYFTIDGGNEWTQIKGGAPTISFRDLAIQRRENDLVCATFGRSFYILDDYSFLRDVEPSSLKNKEGEIYTGREALLYIPRPGHGFGGKGSQGASYFTAKNPPFGAVFTYYLADEYNSLKKIRQEKEKSLIKENKNIEFPGWDEVEAERRQEDPIIWLTIKDADGSVVRKIKGKNKKGFNRASWDLRYPSLRSMNLQRELPKEERSGFMVLPGSYTVTLSKQIDGVITDLAGPKNFTVKRLYDGALKRADNEKQIAFTNEVTGLQKELTAATIKLNNTIKKVNVLQSAASKMSSDNSEVLEKIYSVKQRLLDLDENISGNKSKNEVGEKNNPTIMDRFYNAYGSSSRSTYGPTQTHLKSLEIAKKQFEEFKLKLKQMVSIEIPMVEKLIIDAGGPLVE